MALELKNNGQPIDRNTYQISYIITPEEQEILSRYVGWGGIPEVLLSSKIPYFMANKIPCFFS